MVNQENLDSQEHVENQVHKAKMDLQGHLACLVEGDRVVRKDLLGNVDLKEDQVYQENLALLENQEKMDQRVIVVLLA